MDEATETLLDGLLEGEEAGASITWNNNSYPCCSGPELGGKLLGSGGFRVTAQVTIVVRLSLFPAPTAQAPVAGPQEKQRISFMSAPGAAARPLRIDTRTVFRNALLILECNDPNQAL